MRRKHLSASACDGTCRHIHEGDLDQLIRVVAFRGPLLSLNWRGGELGEGA